MSVLPFDDHLFQSAHHGQGEQLDEFRRDVGRPRGARGLGYQSAEPAQRLPHVLLRRPGRRRGGHRAGQPHLFDHPR